MPGSTALVLRPGRWRLLLKDGRAGVLFWWRPERQKLILLDQHAVPQGGPAIVNQIAEDEGQQAILGDSDWRGADARWNLDAREIRAAWLVSRRGIPAPAEGFDLAVILGQGATQVLRSIA